MVDSITTVPRVVGPFFVNSASLDTVDLESEDGRVTVPTYSLTLDVQDAGNNIFRIGIGIAASDLRNIVLALQSAMLTAIPGGLPYKA